MKAVLGILLAAAMACASAPKMTDAERRERANVNMIGDAKGAADVLTDFLLAEGYAIDKLDETGFVSTEWKQMFSAGVSSAVGVKFESRVQAKIRPAGEVTNVEFWVFQRADDNGTIADEEKLDTDPETYDGLVARFRSFLAERGVAMQP